jgi:SNF2 family DNA or RNA helicase
MNLYVPRDYQRALRDFALDRPRCNWWAGTGTGKTSAGIMLYDHLRTFNEVEKLLVVSTKRIAKGVWSREVDKWWNFRHLSVATAIGTVEQRRKALFMDADITTINYDNLPWLMDTVGDHWPWDMVIADESTKLKGLRIDLRTSPSGKTFMRKSGGSERAMRLARVAHKKVRRWVNLTGTPAANGLIDLWGQAWYLDAGQRLGRSFSAFQERWFRSVQVGSEAFQTKLEPQPWADAQIKQALQDISLTIEAKDYFDLPPTIVNRIPVTLPPDAYDQYQQMEAEFFIQVSGQDIEAVNAGAKSMKCRQLASGAVYSADGQTFGVHDAKLEALGDLIASMNGEPLIVAYQFKSDLQRLQKAFPQGRYFDDKKSTLEAFCAGRIPLLFLHPASAAHGIDGMQQACRHICWFSMTWNLEEYEQAIERIGATRQVQSGTYREVYVHLLLAEDTIDQEMIDRIETKASVQDSIKAAMKKRGKL